MKKNLPKFVLMLLIISTIAFFYTQLTQVGFVEFYKKIDLLNRKEVKEVFERFDYSLKHLLIAPQNEATPVLRV